MDPRALTSGEIALAAAMFGDAIDYARVTVHARRWMPFQPRDTVMSPDGNLWIPPGSPHLSPDFSLARTGLQGLFIHEMTHVWQAQRSGRWWLPLMRHPFCRYAYRYRPGRPFAAYGIEQQAEIVRHAWLLRRGIAVPGKPPRAVYEALLPFPAFPRTPPPL